MGNPRGSRKLNACLRKQGSQDLLTEATETLLYNAIIEYRNTLKAKQATADGTSTAGARPSIYSRHADRF